MGDISIEVLVTYFLKTAIHVVHMFLNFKSSEEFECESFYYSFTYKTCNQYFKYKGAMSWVLCWRLSSHAMYCIYVDESSQVKGIFLGKAVVENFMVLLPGVIHHSTVSLTRVQSLKLTNFPKLQAV